MTRIEIDVTGDVTDEMIYKGKMELRLVREFGENSTEASSVAGRVETLVSKSLEQYLKGFLPQFEKLIDDAAKVVQEEFKKKAEGNTSK